MINIIAPHRTTARAQFNKNMAARPYPKAYIYIYSHSIRCHTHATYTPPHKFNHLLPGRVPYTCFLSILNRTQTTFSNGWKCLQLNIRKKERKKKLFHARSCTLITHMPQVLGEQKRRKTPINYSWTDFPQIVAILKIFFCRTTGRDDVYYTW